MTWNTLVDALDSSLQFHTSPFRPVQRREEIHYATMTVLEHSDHWIVSIDVPGTPEDQLQVTCQDGILTVSGERPPVSEEGARQLYCDRLAGTFRRTLKLGEGADHSSIDATLSDGVLTLKVFRTAESGLRQIPVKTLNRTVAPQTT
ncbi:MAG: Hsp20/alpha crystallin family protein [Planctomycetaceae bacterium]